MLVSNSSLLTKFTNGEGVGVGLHFDYRVSTSKGTNERIRKGKGTFSGFYLKIVY